VNCYALKINRDGAMTSKPRFEAGDRVRVAAGLYTGCKGYVTGKRWGGGDWEYPVKMDDGTEVYKWEDEIIGLQKS